MTAQEKYVFLRQAGFSHGEAVSIIATGQKPNCNTALKQKAYARITEGG